MKQLLLISFLILGSIVFGQSKNEVIQQRIEFIAQDLESEDVSLEDIFDVLNLYYDNPLNLNEATKEELQELLLVNDFQINSLLSWREKNGPFKTIFEIQEVEYWDLLTLENIFPFVRVSKVEENERGDFQKYLREGKVEAYFRYQRNIEDKSGYADVTDEEREESSKYYWGDPNKLYSRIRYTHKNDLSIGVTMEKDPGEQLFGKKSPYGFDFYSAHAYYSGNKFLRKVVVGDYQVQIGQGLALWTGYGFSKTADATSAKKNARGLKPYTSTDEVRFMRGAGVELGIKNISLTTWASYKGVDGSVEMLDTIDSEEARMASSINMTGYHRTTSELERKNSLMELIYGANVKYETRSFQIGISAVQHAYDAFYQRSDQLMNKYQFAGKELLNLSADYSYIFRNVSLYGEVAQSRGSNAVAVIQGLTVAMGRRASITALYRNYPKDYHTFYAQGFGDGSNTNNESGIYLGGTFKLSKEWSLNSYVDFFKSPWLKFRVDSPSEGHEILGQLKYRPSPRFETYLRVREKEKMINASGDYKGNIRPIENYKQRKYQLGLTTDLGEGWIWRSRIDYVTDQRESSGKQGGFAISQDLLYRSKKFPVEVSMRYAIFNTDSYETRVYAYEYNLENVFSIPAYFNKGSRAYLMLRYTFLNDRCDLWVRYAAFIYNQEESLSSGPEEIKGNMKSEVGVQLRVRF
ncbi:MAG TPA: helix-hairpin-helix domain-containing protein [Brumimicrobium sp.]|nr:helix-hairpin-helix domain-containing protein [Brumimicrobium sp.]